MVTLFGLFAEIFSVQTAIKLRLFYIIVVVLLPVLVWVWDFRLSPGYIVFLAYLWIDGIASVVMLGDDPKRMLMEAVGITLCSLYYLLFYRYQRWTMPELFDKYAEVAFWVCVAAFPISLVESLHEGAFARFQSICTEPAHFCGLVLPAFFYYASSFTKNSLARRRAVIMMVAILGADSSIGYIFLMLSFILLARRHRLALMLLPAILVPTAFATYSLSDDVRLRVDDSIAAVRNVDVADTNLSTYFLLSNVYVTGRSFRERPILGVGLGGYKGAHDKFIGELPGMETFLDSVFAYTAAPDDANSLFLRVTAEFGLVGLFAITFLLIRYRPAREEPYASIGYAVLIYVFTKLFREGSYFTAEMYFFIWAYVFSSVRYRRRARLQLTAATPPSSPVAERAA